MQYSRYYVYREFRRAIEEFGHWFPVSSLTETNFSDITQLESYLRNQFSWLDTDP